MPKRKERPRARDTRLILTTPNAVAQYILKALKEYTPSLTRAAFTNSHYIFIPRIDPNRALIRISDHPPKSRKTGVRFYAHSTQARINRARAGVTYYPMTHARQLARDARALIDAHPIDAAEIAQAPIEAPTPGE